MSRLKQEEQIACSSPLLTKFSVHPSKRYATHHSPAAPGPECVKTGSNIVGA
jgi:hypothetical protein